MVLANLPQGLQHYIIIISRHSSLLLCCGSEHRLLYHLLLQHTPLTIQPLYSSLPSALRVLALEFENRCQGNPGSRRTFQRYHLVRCSKTGLEVSLPTQSGQPVNIKFPTGCGTFHQNDILHWALGFVTFHLQDLFPLGSLFVIILCTRGCFQYYIYFII